MYYLYLPGRLVLRPRVVVRMGGDGGGGSAAAAPAAAVARRRFVGFFTALCEAARLALFAVS
jgi:hypothetical protein